MSDTADFRLSAWTAEFADGAVERAFREESREVLVRQTRLAIVLAAVYYFVFAATDYFAVVGGSSYAEMFIVRMLVCLFGLTVAFTAGRYWWALANGLLPTLTIALAMTGFLSITLFRSYEPAWHGMSMMVMLLGCYVFIPNRFLTALAVCVVASITFLWLVLDHFQMPANQAFNLGLLLFGMNLFGGITCYRISWARRDEYRHTLDQRQANLLLGAEIENRRRLESELRNQAMLDSLTGLPNRRFFLERFEAMLIETRRSQRPLSLLIVDIDYFRQINATYSHVRGDEMLRHLGELCRQLAPAEALVARLSGEEFVLLVPGMGRVEALTLAENLRLTAQSTCVKSLDACLYFTLSVGVAEARDKDSIDLLLSRADEALRAAKYAGRNRVKAA